MGPRALLLALVLLGGCSERRTCYEGDFAPCTCNDGKAGYAACDVASDAFGACGYCGTVPRPSECEGGGGSGGLLGFMETCAADSECETGYCHNFNAKGPKCTMSCQVDSDCPCPSPGCNMMGVCKAP
jgi:hypothetical protein